MWEEISAQVVPAGPPGPGWLSSPPSATTRAGYLSACTRARYSRPPSSNSRPEYPSCALIHHAPSPRDSFFFFCKSSYCICSSSALYCYSHLFVWGAVTPDHATNFQLLTVYHFEAIYRNIWSLYLLILIIEKVAKEAHFHISSLSTHFLKSSRWPESLLP